MVARILTGRNRFFGSQAYWKERYNSGGNSGSGSYGRLAIYKGEFIQRIIEKFGIREVQEFGCGDGNQLSMFRADRYIGWDISDKAIEHCIRKFGKENGKEFRVLQKTTQVMRAEMSLSLDVIYHLVEDDVFENYMNLLFESATKLVVIYSCNFESEPTANHVKPRKFTDHIEMHFPHWKLIHFEKNPYPLRIEESHETSWSDFYVYEEDGLNARNKTHLS